MLKKEQIYLKQLNAYVDANKHAGMVELVLPKPIYDFIIAKFGKPEFRGYAIKCKG